MSKVAQRSRGPGSKTPKSPNKSLDTSWYGQTTRCKLEYLWLPSRGRRDETGLLEVRKALCSLKAFRNDIGRLRRAHYDLEKDEDCLLDKAEAICREWELFGSEDWVIWLAQNWDPDSSDEPPREPADKSPCLRAWIARFHAIRDLDSATPGPVVIEEPPHLAMLIMYPGISQREAQKAAEATVKEFNKLRGAKGARSGRPGLSDWERQELRSEILKLGVVPHGKRQKAIRKIQQTMQSKGRPMSQGTIGEELRRSLAEQGQQVKRHYR